MRFYQNIPAIIICFIIIICSAIVFSLHIRSLSVPKNYGEFEVKNIRDSVKIFKNEQGIPHIIATNEYDTYYALGYIQAQDRLWQMDYQRRLGRGQLSEIFGSETIHIDQFMRAVGFNEIADSLYQFISKKSKSILDAYSDGVNSYIEINKNKLSFEFGALDYIPERWKPTDCLVIGRLMAFGLSISFWTDIAYGEIADKIGVDRALSLVPGNPTEGPYIIDDTSYSSGKNIANYSKLPLEYNTALSTFSNILKDITKIKDEIGLQGSSFGSNSWAISKPKNAQSPAILANDTHLSMGLPPKWFQVHLTCPSFNIVGMSIPGLPMIFSGRNDYIAWGITNVMIDDCDFFIEKIDSSNQDYYYKSEGKKQKFIYKKETIKVRNSLDSSYYVRITDRSAVISDFHLFKRPDFILDYNEKKFKNDFLYKYCLTFSWTGKVKTDDILALYKINTARSWQDFLNGVNIWGMPGQNFTYADKSGNIGIAPSGLIPQRMAQCNPNIPNPGWLPEYSWERVLPSNSLPRLYNPKKHFVASANNMSTKHPQFFVTNHWEPNSRAERIEQLLEETTKYDAREAQLMQMDLLSPYAKKMLSMVIPILDRDTSRFNPIEKASLNKLKGWDFIMSAGSSASSVYNAFLERLIFHTFYDELGERLYKEYVYVSNQPFRKIMELISQDNSIWFDDVFTKQFENKEWIINRSFRDAVKMLTELYNDENTSTWKYGKIHTLTLKHPLSEVKFLKPTVTIGPLEIGGNLTTINNTEWRIYKPFDMVLGASMRFIADMGDTLVYTILPGGSSGDPLSPNYADQTQLWLNGGYIEIPISRAPGKKFQLSTLLIPAKH
jgi:penicillin G amidase